MSLHTATRRQGKIRGAGPGTLRDASSRATKAFYPALSLCDMIFSGVFERHPRLTLAIVEFELSWAPNVLTSMDYTYRERHGEAIYRFKNGMLPSDFFRRNVVLSFQEDAIGIRLREVIGVDNMMWGSDYPHSESTFPQSRKILAEILEGVPDDEQAKIAAGNTARVYNFDVATADRPCLKSRPSSTAAPYGNPRPMPKMLRSSALTSSEASGGNCYRLSFGFGGPISESGACSTCTKTATIFMDDMTAVPRLAASARVDAWQSTENHAPARCTQVSKSRSDMIPIRRTKRCSRIGTSVSGGFANLAGSSSIVRTGHWLSSHP